MLGGCAAPLSTLEPGGPSARAIAVLWWVMLAGAAAITALVAVLLALAWRRRHAASTVNAARWIVGGGLLFPLGVLGVLTAAALIVGERLLPHPAPEVVTVEARAHQFWWRFTHPDLGAGRAVTATELHIPAGRDVDVRITSADVIHSFWVPQLAGKLDAVPGFENVLRIRAAAPGRYQGRCAEFCGVGHAANVFTVVAHPPEEYAATLARLRSEAAPWPANCAACHADGTGAPGLAGVSARAWPPGHPLHALSGEALRAWVRLHAGPLTEAETEQAAALLEGGR
ncbi:cytochrome c oxidase subunit II [Erythrobacteraceae bacterium CFH 75059]|uniref:cytochrome c oxidase subunit II n=1 Tax=Qipengyuania thermophila TaxID=2509361 RepID=UPI0010211322|nr:cytochrome c oxidase subunit II [Qipengyuania thermophila]TCD06668.1 cytochrome c oxidase subunit II [Erythrobacteraceae bacterium CFH 75059]